MKKNILYIISGIIIVLVIFGVLWKNFPSNQTKNPVDVSTRIIQDNSGTLLEDSKVIETKTNISELKEIETDF